MPEIPINDQVFPNLHTDSGNTKIEWDFGLMYAIQTTASFIRIDADQIQWYDYGRFHARHIDWHVDCARWEDQHGHRRFILNNATERVACCFAHQ
jgi:hypothetical protein